MASTEDVPKLADLLRDKGDMILNNECKLTLSTDLLDKLNDSFNLIIEHKDTLNSSFHVLSNTNVSNSLHRDLLFLYDFLQKSKSLKLTLGDPRDEQSDNIDISKFKELRLLELRKVNVNNITGLNILRQKLRNLICDRSINSLRDILERCGADESDGSVWFELKEASFCHNGIINIDSSLKLVPLLTTLDLSYNLIENADSLGCLSNLKYLNLSFNKLTEAPKFAGQICNRLQVLSLQNNFIENIQNLCKLSNLTQLDLHENCLIEHNSLIPLSYLAALQWLNLNGNPLSFYPHHRIKTVQYLHNNTSSVKFFLDNAPINNNEKQFVGLLHPKVLIQSEPLQREHTSSICESSDSFDRSLRVRPALINEFDDIPNETNISIMETPSDPISYKEDLNSLHKDYMRALYDKTGLNQKDVNLLDSFNGSFPKASTPLQDYITDEIAKVNKEVKEESKEKSEYETAPESNVEDDIYLSLGDKEESDDEPETGDSNIFLATIKGQSDEIFVVLGKTHMIERDTVTTKTLAKFSLDSIYVCNKTVENGTAYIYLEFDTIRNVNCRFYFIENEEERERFYERVSKIVESRPPSEGLRVYSCLKCSTQFGVEEQNTIHKGTVQCPYCGSNLVFEDDH